MENTTTTMTITMTIIMRTTITILKKKFYCYILSQVPAYLLANIYSYILANLYIYLKKINILNNLSKCVIGKLFINIFYYISFIYSIIIYLYWVYSVLNNVINIVNFFYFNFFTIFFLIFIILVNIFFLYYLLYVNNTLKKEYPLLFLILLLVIFTVGICLSFYTVNMWNPRHGRGISGSSGPSWPSGSSGPSGPSGPSGGPLNTNKPSNKSEYTDDEVNAYIGEVDRMRSYLNSIRGMLPTNEWLAQDSIIKNKEEAVELYKVRLNKINQFKFFLEHNSLYTQEEIKIKLDEMRITSELWKSIDKFK